MRKLMWFTLGLSIACILCAYLWLTEGLWILSLVMGMLSAGTLLFCRRRKWLRYVAAVGIGCTVGFLWFSVYALYYLGPVALLEIKAMKPLTVLQWRAH